MAAASGLTLVPEGNLNPMETTTLGTGELMMHALSGGMYEGPYWYRRKCNE